MGEKKLNTTKIAFTVLIVIIVVVAAVIYLMTSQQKSTDQTKISNVPAEIKTQSEAKSIENDTSSILNEVRDTLQGIDQTLPDV